MILLIIDVILYQNGIKLSSGHLEITETDLILYLKGKQPVKWPLKYLKRYGFEVRK